MSDCLFKQSWYTFSDLDVHHDACSRMMLTFNVSDYQVHGYRRAERNDGAIIITCGMSWTRGAVLLSCSEDLNLIWIVSISAPSLAKSLSFKKIFSAQATALDGAGMTPTVLQCTTVRQEGPLPREDTAVSVFTT